MLGDLFFGNLTFVKFQEFGCSHKNYHSRLIVHFISNGLEWFLLHSNDERESEIETSVIIVKR